jgi:hypothetical protein
VLDTAGIVPGPAGSRQIVAALGGERFGGAASIGGGPTIILQVGTLIASPQSWDMVANELARRLGYATGR